MHRQALIAVMQQLPQLNDRLRLGPDEAVELIADDALIAHLEQRRVGRAPQALTPPMSPDRLLTLLHGMGLALDLDRRLAPSRSIFRAPALVDLPLGPGRPAPGRPGEPS
jgi:hypothetical protein